MAKSFSIQEFGEKVGVSTSALRAWERRYQLFDPDRTQAGHRTYGTDDLLLYWFVELQREAGGSLAKIAKKGRPAILLEAHSYLSGVQEPSNYIMNLLKQNRFAETFRFLEILAAVCETPVIFADNCLLYMRDVGISWHNGELCISAEHAFTTQVRHFMTAFLFQDGPSTENMALKGQKVICCAMEGELHELGILRVALYLKYWGFEVLYLGANTPWHSLLNCILSTRPCFVCVTSTQSIEAQTLIHQVCSQSTSAKVLCPFVVGGSGSAHLKVDKVDLQAKGVYLTQDMDDLKRIALAI